MDCVLGSFSVCLWDPTVAISQSVQRIFITPWNEKFCTALQLKCFGDGRTSHSRLKLEVILPCLLLQPQLYTDILLLVIS